jgi:hypothetical protein
LALDGAIFRSKNFEWNVNLNMTHFTNEITSLDPQVEAAGGEKYGNQILRKGGSIYELYLVKFAGTDKSNGQALYYTDVKDAEGIYKLSENGGIPTAVQLTIPCSSGCKLFVLEADETTRNAILEQYDSTDASLIPWMLGFTAQSVITFLNNSKTAFKQRAYLNLMKQNSTSPPKWKPLDQGVPFDNTNGFTFTCIGAKNGNYNWTAYYWND